MQRSTSFGVPNANSIKQMLLDWCRAKTRGYEVSSMRPGCLADPADHSSAPPSWLNSFSAAHPQPPSRLRTLHSHHAWQGNWEALVWDELTGSKRTHNVP